MRYAASFCRPSQAGAEVDTIATELVPQLQKHTEQLTNVYALIDKMHEHLELVKDSGTPLSLRSHAQTIFPCSAVDTASSWGRRQGDCRLPR